MTLDWIYIILLAFSLYRGYRKGIILSAFSFLAILVGIAAASKLSAGLVTQFGHGDISFIKWLPLLAYLIVFLLIAFIVRRVGRLLQKSIEMVALGSINRLLGALFSAFLLSIVFSLFLWLLTLMGLLSADKTSSFTYTLLEPLAPHIFEGIGTLIPWFKEGFHDLNLFFGKVNSNLLQH